MAFTPVSLPIQQILMTNFVTDIATITNANTLLLQANLEDLLNDLEIDVANKSIGTDAPINYLKADTVILQDTGLIYQTGTPTPTIIASLTKNISGKSVFTVDNLVTNINAGFNNVTLNNLTVATSAIINGDATFNAPVTLSSSFIESKENVQADLLWGGVISTPAQATITLSNTSRQNIFLTLRASTAPDPTPVYDGIGAINPGITEFQINIDFDATNPPDQNAKFTIHIVDIIASGAPVSIISFVQLATIPIKFIAGTNLNTTNSIIMHDGVNFVGLLSSATLNLYGSNVTFNYIIDKNNDDRLIATSLVGTEIF